MDIGKKVTVTYQLKRGNYAVNDRSYTGFTHNGELTCGCIISDIIYSSTLSVNGSRNESRVCNCNGNYKQTRGSMCEEDRIQGEPIPSQCEEQAFVSSWSVATDVGQTSLVYTQASNGSKQIRITSVRQLVRSVQVPPREELVLTNEST